MEPFEEKMARLTAQLKEQMAEAARLDELIRQIWRIWVWEVSLHHYLAPELF